MQGLCQTAAIKNYLEKDDHSSILLEVFVFFRFLIKLLAFISRVGLLITRCQERHNY
jgi:hypothetical protein